MNDILIKMLFKKMTRTGPGGWIQNMNIRPNHHYIYKYEPRPVMLPLLRRVYILNLSYSWNINSASLMSASKNLMAVLHLGSPSKNSTRN